MAELGGGSARDRYLLRFAVALLLFIALLAHGPETHGEPFERGLLWEVSRPGVGKSTLFGTMHSADQRLLWLSPAVEEAFANSRTFVLEMVPSEAASERFVEALELPAEQRLSAQLPAADFARLGEILGHRGISRSRLDRQKPWAALLLLTEGQTATSHSLDVDLYVRARAAGKLIEDLDSVEEQIAVFDGLPLATQLVLLGLAIQRHEQLPADLEKSIAAYRRGDLRRLMQLTTHYPGAGVGAKQHLAMLEKKIIRDRSVVMAYRLQGILRRGKAFVAIGALHLYGRHGVLQLLRDEGWTIRRLD